MPEKRPKPSLTALPVHPIHAEDNRLARRLFQLEQRVDALEDRVAEMEEMLRFLIYIKSFEESGEMPSCFCDCEEDDDEDRQRYW